MFFFENITILASNQSYRFGKLNIDEISIDEFIKVNLSYFPKPEFEPS